MQPCDLGIGGGARAAADAERAEADLPHMGISAVGRSAEPSAAPPGGKGTTGRNGRRAAWARRYFGRRPISPAIRLRCICDVPAATVALRLSRKWRCMSHSMLKPCAPITCMPWAAIFA